MRQTTQFLLAFFALALVGCGVDRDKSNDKDSVMTDSAKMDTADMKAAPADTTVMRTDSTGQELKFIY